MLKRAKRLKCENYSCPVRANCLLTPGVPGHNLSEENNRAPFPLLALIVTAPLLALHRADSPDRHDGSFPVRRVVVRATEPVAAPTDLFRADLGAKLRAGDESAFTAVIAATVPALIRYAGIRLGISHDAAEELVQDVFARLWLNRTTIPNRVTRAYLFAMVRNAALNAAAHERVVTTHAAWHATRHATHVVSGSPSVSDASASTDAALTLERLLARLPDRRRQAIELRYWGGLSYAELAETLGTTPASAERLVARGLATLQELAEKLA